MRVMTLVEGKGAVAGAGGFITHGINSNEEARGGSSSETLPIRYKVCGRGGTVGKRTLVLLRRGEIYSSTKSPANPRKG